MVTASGLLSLPISYLKDTIAGSSNFRTWTGTGSPTTAKARIHIGRAADTATLPLATVGFGGDFRYYNDGAPNEFYTDASVEMAFFDDFSSALSEEDAAYTFMNSLGPIITDIKDLSSQAGYLSIDELSVKWGPARTDEDEEVTRGYIFGMAFNVSYIGI